MASSTLYNELLNTLKEYGQEHLLRFWDDLNEGQKDKLADQIKAYDWAKMNDCIEKYVINKPEYSIPEDLEPAPYYPVHPHSDKQRKLYEKAAKKGGKELKHGKVAAFTVAGGQGTRLGFDGPKGTFPIAPISGKTLFQLFAEMIVCTQDKYNTVIPWYILTSPVNHADTENFFEENDYFGLDRKHVSFVQQGTMPAVGFDGKVLLEEPDSMALSPDGHGGALEALKKSGALDDMRERGIEHISYWQVDNPLVQPFDKLFLGLHTLEDSDMSCRSLTKTGPFEKLGNFCISGGKIMVIEYSDMPSDLARAQDASGRLRFREGSPAIHIFKRDFVESLTSSGDLNLPFHRAEKKVPYVDENGNKVHPEDKNAVKLEKFIFDALPKANNVVILQAERHEHFAPLKSSTGQDSIETCRQMMQNRSATWLERAGISVPRNEAGHLDCEIEMTPKLYAEHEDVAKHADKLTTPNRGTKENYE